MKIFVLTLVLVAGLLSANAQQLTISPKNKLSADKNTFKLDTTYNKLFTGDLTSPLTLAAVPAIEPNISRTTAINFYSTNMDNMPIARLNNTDAGMPIVKTDRTAYTMPVAGKSQPSIYYMQNPKEVIVQQNVRP